MLCTKRMIFFVKGDVATASNVNGLFWLDVKPQTNSVPGSGAEHVANVSVAASAFDLWHKRLGHLNHVCMKELRGKMDVGVNFPDCHFQPREPCVLGKHSLNQKLRLLRNCN